jgi:glycosyltransferase involved in cell wall biosynthesis
LGLVRILHVGDDFAALRPCGLTLYASALMRAQVADGHELSYLFSGRHYPLLDGPRFKRWHDGGVAMYELVGSRIHSHWEAGTREPLLDLDEPVGEAAFAAALRAARPDIVHIHDLTKLPSSLILQAKAAGLPVVMTLHDYKPLCASVRLLDADGQLCTRRQVGEDCSRNCAGAPSGPWHLIDSTLRYEQRRFKQALPMARRLDFARLAPIVHPLFRATLGTPPIGGWPDEQPPAPAPPAEYQRRRDVNVERLALCDRLIAPSQRVAEIYAELGVDEDRLTVQRLTLPHLERLEPSPERSPGTPLTFVTLGGCASPSKGSRLMIEALRELERQGRGGDYRLYVLGNVEPAIQDELVAFPSVFAAGQYAAGDLDRLLGEGDVGILPSTWEEAHGFVGIEMLAKGMPLIGNPLGGIPEYLNDGVTGWLNHSCTGAGIAELMAAAIDDPDEVARLQRSVRVRRHELVRPMAEHVAELESLYAELIPGRAGTDSPTAPRYA